MKTIDQRQKARRMADKRRPMYRQAMYILDGAAILSAYAAAGVPAPACRVTLLIFAGICMLYSLHFDGESRREY